MKMILLTQRQWEYVYQIVMEGGLFYEEICYACIALAIAIGITIVIAIADPENIILGGRHELYKSRRNSTN